MNLKHYVLGKFYNKLNHIFELYALQYIWNEMQKICTFDALARQF